MTKLNVFQDSTWYINSLDREYWYYEIDMNGYLVDQIFVLAGYKRLSALGYIEYRYYRIKILYIPLRQFSEWNKQYVIGYPLSITKCYQWHLKTCADAKMLAWELHALILWTQECGNQWILPKSWTSTFRALELCFRCCARSPGIQDYDKMIEPILCTGITLESREYK